MRGKQLLIIILLIVAMAAFLIGPLLKGKSTEKQGAQFTFVENLALPFGQKAPLKVNCEGNDFQKVELYLNDSLLKTWTKPGKELSFLLDASIFGIGAKTISLVSVDQDGQEFNDTRFLRIVSDVAPANKKAVVVQSFTHNPNSFTQGLEFNEGILFESTGLKGSSKIAHVDLKTGKQLKEIGLDGTYFGEGITVFGDKVYQLTWQEQKCFVYDKKSLQIQKDFPYTGEGWGMCNDGTNLIMSNGTEFLTFRDPSSFQTVKTIEVYDNVGPRVRLNELEYINGKIYANVWMLDIILVIDPETGKVLEQIDCSDVVKAGKGNGEVLNGIAFDPKSQKMYLTGKNWSSLLEVKIQ